MSKRDLLVIGEGAGGLVVVSVAERFGFDVVLMNKEEIMAGDGMHYGCVASKFFKKCFSCLNLVQC